MILYRYMNSGSDVFSVKFETTRETRCFYFFNAYGKEKRTSKTAIHRFAYPTKHEALFSFCRRKEKQIEILTFQLERAKDGLAKSQKMLEERTE